MKLPRWLIVVMLIASAAAIIAAAALWWITWPTRTIREFTVLLEQGRFDEATQFLRKPERLTVESFDGQRLVVLATHPPPGARGSSLLHSPETWQTWCRLDNLLMEPRQVADLFAGRQSFSYRREFITPVSIGGSAERGAIVLRFEHWAATPY
jgi:hypothetical protein